MKYIFGEVAFRKDLPPITWEPDSRACVNPHLLLAGSSGSGKTTMLYDIVVSLNKAMKHIFIFDLKGDMEIHDDGKKIGNYIEFTAWNSKFGINPFEFDTGVSEAELAEIIANNGKMTDEQRYKIQNSGPKVQVNRIVEILKKNFLPNMGAGQRDILMYLFTDTYLSKDIKYDDVSTWTNELPSLKDTLDLISKIAAAVGGDAYVANDEDTDFIMLLHKYFVKIRKLENRRTALMNAEEGSEKSGARESVTTVDDKSDEVLAKDVEADIEEDEVEDGEEVEKEDEDEAGVVTEQLMYNVNTLSTPDEVTAKIKEHEGQINELTRRYRLNRADTLGTEDVLENTHWFKSKGIDLSKYWTKDAVRTMMKMQSYINALVDAGVFHSVRPPVKAGLNIINISGLDIEIQRFIVDIWLGKVFRSCKIRGTYTERKNLTRGAKFDTIVIIDESKLVSGTSREKNDPYSFLNRIATESRSFGLALLVASQSAEHFPPEFLKNFYTQVILNTSVADADAARKSFGVDKQLLEFTQKGWGKALVKTGRVFQQVNLTEKGL